VSDYGTPDGRPIGHGQAQLLRYVRNNPGCSVAEANGRNNPYGRSYTDRAWALYHRGLLNIDTGRANRYRLTITPDGELALGMFLHRAANPNCADDCCARKPTDRQPSLRQLIDRAEYLPPGYAERDALIDELGLLVAKQITSFVRNASQDR
jgi:hypothetical protein